jgi:Ca-activated chloride channel family protein
MTFQSPWWLLLLLAPIAILVAYLLVQRARQRAVVRFTSVDLLASVAPRRPGWQRHVSAIGMLAALVILVVAIAGPARQQKVALDRATVMLTLDTSGSMQATDIDPSRLVAAQTQATDFVNSLPEGLQVGLVAFDTTPRTLVTPTTDYPQAVSAIDSLQVGGGTATAAAIEASLAAIKAAPPSASGKPVPAVIVLMSDGAPTIGIGDTPAIASAVAAAQDAKAAGVPIYTIAFGTPQGVVNVQGQSIPVPSDPATMALIAQDSGGKSFSAQSAGELKTVYDQIGRAVAYQVRTVDLTGLFTGIGLAAALLACCAALYWNQRMV